MPSSSPTSAQNFCKLRHSVRLHYKGAFKEARVPRSRQKKDCLIDIDINIEGANRGLFFRLRFPSNFLLQRGRHFCMARTILSLAGIYSRPLFRLWSRECTVARPAFIIYEMHFINTLRLILQHRLSEWESDSFRKPVSRGAATPMR